MKTFFTKLVALISLLLIQISYGQQIKIPIIKPSFIVNPYNPEDTLYITSANGNVAGAGVITTPLSSRVGANGNNLSTEQMIANSINLFPTEKYLKAKSGEAVNLTFKFKIKSGIGFTPVIGCCAHYNQPPLNDDGGIEGYRQQENILNTTWQGQGLGFSNSQHIIDNLGQDRQEITYSGSVTFPLGTFKGWLVFEFTVWQRDVGGSPVGVDCTVVIPYVVEGPLITVSQANPVAIKGYIREPAIPQMILHNPPGDMSTVTFQTNQEACRSMSEALTTEETNAGRLNITLGIAGSAGLFVSTNFEFSVTASLSGGGGSTLMKSSGKQNCVSILNAISTTAGSARANDGSIYLGYSSDIAYGLFPIVVINTSPTVSVVRDSSVIFGVVPGSATPFYYTKGDILNDMANNRAIINNMTYTPKLRHQALSQNRIWQQVLQKDSLNINDPTAPVLTSPFTFTGNAGAISTSVTQSVSTTDTYDVSHFLEIGAGASFVLKVGGSGVDGGYEFKTKKTKGASVSNTSNTSTTIAYTLQDNDAGDSFRVKIVKDKSYGTPIFLVDSVQSRTSCPYEGGYKRDQPRLEIVGSSQNNITIPNVTLGTPASFQVKLCNNNTTETRTYNLGFVSQTNLQDLTITAAGSTGSQFGSFTVPANSCRVENYDVNISRRYPTSGVNFSNLELELYTACEPSIKSSIIANVSFAAPPPAVVTANNTDVCSGSPVMLTATCPVNYSINWYTSLTGGFVVASGSTVTVNPTTNTVYYVGCESLNHIPPRVASKMVLVGTPSTVLNLTNDFTASTFQIANTTITASNKIFSPASVTYKAGNSLTFNPGFETKTGSNFSAKIGGCN